MNDLLSLQDLFNKKIFRIPDYQRGYSWSTQQLEEFWSDVINLLPNKEHYTGMISLKKLDREYTTNWNDEKWLLDNWGFDAYHIVDGQQRLTTFIILINEIVNYYKKTNTDKDLDKIFVNSIPLSKIIEDYLVITKPDSEGVVKTYKFGYEVDNPSYEYFKTKILGSGTVGNDIETFYTLNLERAKDFFTRQINKLVDDNGIEALEDLFKKLTQKMMFNMYYIDNDFNVFIAFETMNNRGKKLSYIELLKNRLIYLSTLFNVPEDNKNALRKEINETWKTIYGNLGKNKLRPLNDDEFLQTHWMIYFGYTRSNQVTFNSFLLNDYFTQQNIFNDKYELPSEEVILDDSLESLDEDNDDIVEDINEVSSDKKKEKLTMGAINNYINSMKELIPYWYLIHNPGEIQNNQIRLYLERINRLGFVNFKPLITVLLSKKDVDDDTKVKVLKLIERFIFLHYRLNGYFSTFKNSFFYNLAHYYYFNERTIEDVIKECSDIDYLSSNNVANMNGIFGKFDKLFKYAGFYSWASIRYVLYEYERYLMADKGTVKILPEDIFKKDEKDHYSIEHIYPQTPTEDDWLNKFNMFDDNQKRKLNGTLGNLLPLSQSINSSLQNYTFDAKKTREPRGYLNGSYSEIEVGNYPTWTANEILERGLKIVNFMEKEWNFIIPNKADRIKFLGLDFMIQPGDENIDATIPIKEEEQAKIKEVVFDENVFNKLISGSSSEIMNVFYKLDNYVMSLDEEIMKGTTTVYYTYATSVKHFIDIWFQSNSLKYILMHGEYDDPKGMVKQLADSYNWTNDMYMIVTPDCDIEYVENILKQSYEKLKNRK